MILQSGFTIAAQAREGQLAAGHPAAGESFDLLRQGVGNLDLVQIQNRVAAVTDEMDVGGGIGVVALRTVYIADADDVSLLPEERQIPVNRRHGDIRMLLLEHGVNHIR